jgi:nitrate reductase NapAB chaperone NapD
MNTSATDIRSNLSSLDTRNTDRVANLVIYIRNAERGHMASKHAIHTLRGLLRISLDYHRQGEEEKCAVKLGKADKILRRTLF